METIEVSGKSVEEAVATALARLGLQREKVVIEVLSKGRTGILGFGAEEARVRVTPLVEPAPEESQLAPMAVEALEGLMAAMKIKARIQVRDLTLKEKGQESSIVALNITGNDLGVLIGRRGETLASLEYLVNLILSRRLRGPARVGLDVEGYRLRRAEALKELALRVSQRVKSSGRMVTLEPMPARERRIVHLALRDDPDITTQSLGEGENRKVAIMPKKRP